MPRSTATVLGLVSDLHGRFDPVLPRMLAGVSRILVAGDIVEGALLARLAAIAPITAVRGNNDHSPELLALPEFARLEVAGRLILVVHDASDRRLARELLREPADILVVGHSHQPRVERQGGLLIVNPGSAGPRRFRLPRTAGTLTLSPRRAPRVALWDLDRDVEFFTARPDAKCLIR